MKSGLRVTACALAYSQICDSTKSMGIIGIKLNRQDKKKSRQSPSASGEVDDADDTDSISSAGDADALHLCVLPESETKEEKADEPRNQWEINVQLLSSQAVVNFQTLFTDSNYQKLQGQGYTCSLLYNIFNQQEEKANEPQSAPSDSQAAPSDSQAPQINQYVERQKQLRKQQVIKLQHNTGLNPPMMNSLVNEQLRMDKQRWDDLQRLRWDDLQSEEKSIFMDDLENWNALIATLKSGEISEELERKWVIAGIKIAEMRQKDE